MKYDWISLKQKYLLGEYKNLKEFAKKQGINYILLRRNAVGWVNKKKKILEQNCNKTITKIEAKKVREAVENYEQINKKHYDLASDLIVKLEKLKPKNPLEIESMTRALKNIQQIQRIAKGMDEKINNEICENVKLTFNEFRQKEY